MSTGGAATNAMMKQVIADNRVGIIKTPNQPMYKRLLVLVIHPQNCSHAEALSRLCNVVVMVRIIAFVFYDLLGFLTYVLILKQAFRFVKHFQGKFVINAEIYIKFIGYEVNTAVDTANFKKLKIIKNQIIYIDSNCFNQV